MARAVFCDIDGCLGPGKHTALDLAGLAGVRRLISQLAAQGTGFHLCTGRPQPYAEAFAQVLDVQTPFICENGAMVFTPAQDRATRLISEPDLAALHALREALVPEGFIFEVGNEYSLSLSWEGITRTPQAEIAARRKALEVRYSSFGLNWTNSHTSVDITPRGVGKQTGIAAVLAEVGLGPENAFAIGDSHNDMKMLEFVGYPMCPSNAVDEVKVLCKTIATQPAVAGVAALLSGLLKE